MTIRVTVGASSAASLAGLTAASQRLDVLQQQLSTGNQITKPSDDPAGTVRALALRGDLKKNAQYARAQSDATGWLSVADTTYGQITDLVQRVRTLTVQASNTGASTGDSATAIANEISSIRDSIMKLANTTYNGQPIFGGTTIYGQGGTTPDAPFQLSDADDPASAIVYKGDGVDPDDGTGVIKRTIGDQNTVQINQTGASVFGTDSTGNTGLFHLLDQLVTNLKSGDPDNPQPGDNSPNGTEGSSTEFTNDGGALAAIDDALGKITAARSASGAALSRVQAAQSTGATDKVSIQTNLSQIQDIDLADVAIKVNTAQVVYQASLQTTANIRQMSLLNYLR